VNGLIDATSAASPQRGEKLQTQGDIASADLDAARDAHKAAVAVEQTARRTAGAAGERLKRLQEEIAELERAALLAAIRDDEDFARRANDLSSLSHQAAVLKKAAEQFKFFGLRDAERATLAARLRETEAEYDLTGLRHDFLLNGTLVEMKSTALHYNGGAIELSETQFDSGVLGELRRKLDHIERNRQNSERHLARFDAETFETRQKFEMGNT
jgi:hypothetical protein